MAKAIASEHYDVVAQFIGYTAEDVKRDIRLFQNKTRQYIFISSASAYQKPLADYRITEFIFLPESLVVYRLLILIPILLICRMKLKRYLQMFYLCIILITEAYG